MRNLIFVMIALGLAVAQVFAKKVKVDFINTQHNTCAVYLDDEYLGRMKSGETLQKRLKKGEHTLSFVVFNQSGEYYTYVRDLDIQENNAQFMLLSNDTGLVNVEAYEGVNPAFVASIQNLPVVDETDLSQLIFNLDKEDFELYKADQIKEYISEHRIATHNLRDLLDQLHEESLKAGIAKMAYQHIVDKHNFQNILFDLSTESVQRIEQHTAIVNKYI